MKKAIYPDSEILAVGDRLRAERPGGQVTGWDVLKALGSRGKFERINRIWTAHLAQAVEIAAVPAVVETPLPPKVAEARDMDLVQVSASLDAVRGIVAGLYASTWATADGVAQGRVAAERKTFADQRDEFERQMALAQEVQAEIEVREDSLEARVDALEADLATTRTSETQLTERLVAAEAQAARSAERSTAEIARLAGQLETAQSATALAKQEAAAATAAAGAAREDADRSRAAVAAAADELKNLRDKLTLSERSEADLRVAAGKEAAATAAALDDAERSRTALAAGADEIGKLRSKLAAADLAATELRASAARDVSEAEKRAAGAEAAAAAIRERVNALEADVGRERASRETMDGQLGEWRDRAVRAEALLPVVAPAV